MAVRVWRGLAAQLSPTSMYQAHLLDTHISTRLMVLPERTRGSDGMKVAAVSLGAAGAVVGHYILKSRITAEYGNEGLRNHYLCHDRRKLRSGHDAIAYHDGGYSRVAEPETILRGMRRKGASRVD